VTAVWRIQASQARVEPGADRPLASVAAGAPVMEGREAGGPRRAEKGREGPPWRETELPTGLLRHGVPTASRPRAPSRWGSRPLGTRPIQGPANVQGEPHSLPRGVRRGLADTLPHDPEATKGPSLSTSWWVDSMEASHISRVRPTSGPLSLLRREEDTDGNSAGSRSSCASASLERGFRRLDPR
jgi:hypothetical protein